METVAVPGGKPAAEPSPASASAESAAEIVLVEDNEDAAETLSELLSLWGYRCAVAASGPEALTLVEIQKPRLVLLDIGLPGMDGYEVARRLRQDLDYQGPIVGLSGYGQNDDRRRGREAGFNDHLTKPVDTELLHRLLASCCSR